MTKLSLASEFPPASPDAWALRASAALKGLPLEKLTRQSRDGLAIAPLHGRDEAPPLATRPGGKAWEIVQRVDLADPAAANAQILEDLNGGATGLALALPHTDAPSLALMLKDVAVHAIHLRFEPGLAGATEAFRKFAELRALNPALLNVDFGLTDPQAAKALRAADFSGALLNADGRTFHDAGATEAQELGFTLSRAIAYLRAMEGDAGSISFTLAASPDMFTTLAKFRALRLLWARVLEAAGLPQTPVHLHAQTSFRHMTRTDPHVNLLRAVAGVFGAGLGGADSICVLPFTAADERPDSFARRMARNAQVILLEESNLHRVGDPAAGSGFIAGLTEGLAQKAWEWMQQAQSGADTNAIIATAHATQMGRVAKRAEPLTGTSEFPNPQEKIGPGPGSLRLSAPFEALRAHARGKHLAVRLVTLGRMADYTARKMWVQNLLAAGGIAVSDEAASVAVLCGSDEAYAAEAAAQLQSLKAAGLRHVWLAGKFSLEGASPLHAGMDVIEALSRLQKELGA